MGAVERFERQLRERLETAPDSERAKILKEAVALARPLVASRQMTQTQAIATMEAIGREHGIRTLKPAGSGFFRNLPSNDDGPQAA